MGGVSEPQIQIDNWVASNDMITMLRGWQLIWKAISRKPVAIKVIQDAIVLGTRMHLPLVTTLALPLIALPTQAVALALATSLGPAEEL